MSYILDALKKSESERLKRDSPRFADLPNAGRSRQVPRWPWVLAALLAVNAAVILAFLYRDESPVSREARSAEVPVRERPTPEAVQEEPGPAVPSSPAEPEPAGPGIAQPMPGVQSPAAARAATEEPQARGPAAPAPVKAAPPTPTATYMELMADGRLSLPALHLDIHVYSEMPAERFIFVNMQKYRESERLDEGPLVSEIRPEGVILEHRGTAFLLPRE